MTPSVSEHVEGTVSNSKMWTMMGFKVILSWHYLVLFSPLFIGSVDQAFPSFFLGRQLTLYVTLAVSFAVLVGVGRFFLKRNKTAPSSRLIAFSGVLATLATILSIAALGADVPWRLASVILLGFSEAFLIFLWLHYYTEAARGHLFKSFAFDMMAGGLIAFLTCSLIAPIGLIIAFCMPVVATISLLIHWGDVKPVDVASRAVDVVFSQKSLVRHSLKTLLPTAIYAFVFGLLQGGFVVSDIALLMAGNSIVLLGIVFAGAIIFFIPEKPARNADIDTIHRFSLLFFVLGIVGLSFLSGSGAGVLLLASEIAILAGFNLFDFGGLILGVGLSRRLKPGSLFLVNGGRVLVYASLAVGLVVGRAIMTSFGDESNELVLYSLCGVSIALLVATVLTPFHDREGFEDQITRLDVEEKTSEVPRVQEAYPLVVEEKKYINTTSLTSAASLDKRPEKENLLLGKQAPLFGDTGAGTKRLDTPWRRTCGAIAKLYKLSPRETEIFFLIAKGRNAEFVQQKLIISMHTAKTHIANIYHKLGVHSLQEMLSLIEAFREEELYSSGQKGG